MENIRLRDIALDCGELTRDAFLSAPGGCFGKVLRGTWRGKRVAVKILASSTDADNAFIVEVATLGVVRSLIDRARLLESLGQPLNEPCAHPDPAQRCSKPHDLSGYQHLAYVYGVGTEPDLAFVGRPGPAHLIVMEELTGGTLQQMIDAPPGVQPPLDALLRSSADLASALAALAAAHVVHADIKVSSLWLGSPTFVYPTGS